MEESSTPRKTIVQSDALAWLKDAELGPKDAVVASIPDASELPNTAFEPWRDWFVHVAEQIVQRVHPQAPIIFYQSDVRHDGLWVDKGFLAGRVAEDCGAHMLLHRIVCRHPAGTATFGRSGYSHMLLFSKTLKLSQRYGYSDVIPLGGPSAWVRGIGLHACEAIVRMIRQETECDRLVHLFCSKGLLLEVAREQGLHTLGIDLSAKQCRHAKRFDLNAFRQRMIAGKAPSGEENEDSL